MRKVTLDLDQLRVDSFETAQREGEGGTARACSWEGWSDGSVCPTTTPSNCRPCN